tara:strand:+ start:19 stop:408 length:390 start_codon:yes stop_codon:yes gene_type:complete
MKENFNIEIISPERKLFKDKAISVTIPAFEGEMTILPNHISLITFLRPGIINVISQKEEKYFVEEGTVEFSDNNLSILSSTILEFNALTNEKISQMINESKSQLNKENLDDKKKYIFSHKIDTLNKINL